MRFRINPKALPEGELLHIPSLNIVVGADDDNGGEFNVTEEQAAGLVLQCSHGEVEGRFEPVDDEAKAAVELAFAPPASDEMPKDSDPRGDWETFAETNKLDVDPTIKLKADYVTAVKTAFENKES